MKIYIIGSPASGKTTLAKKLSKRYGIKHYELDCIVYDDENNHIKRTEEEISKKFNEILKEESFILEDVGRSKFKKGREVADVIYYIKLSKLDIYKRLIKRWINQRKGIESYNYPPTIYQLYGMFKDVKNYQKVEKQRVKELEIYKNKVEFLNKDKLNILKGGDNL
mgnify:FL=1